MSDTPVEKSARIVLSQHSPRWMTDAQIRAHFGLTERALMLLKSIRDFPQRDRITNKRDSKAVDRFFDRMSGLDGQTLPRQGSTQERL